MSYLDLAQLKRLLAKLDSKFLGKNATAVNANKVNNHTVNADVPSGAKFTDTNTTYGVATQTTNGLMSAADKKKLDSITDGNGVKF